MSLKKKEKFDKIVEKLKRQGTDETDSGSSADISVETMKFAIRCLHATQNPFHAFMNVLRVKEGNKFKRYSADDF